MSNCQRWSFYTRCFHKGRLVGGGKFSSVNWTFHCNLHLFPSFAGLPTWNSPKNHLSKWRSPSTTPASARGTSPSPRNKTRRPSLPPLLLLQLPPQLPIIIIAISLARVTDSAVAVEVVLQEEEEELISTLDLQSRDFKRRRRTWPGLNLDTFHRHLLTDDDNDNGDDDNSRFSVFTYLC